MAIEIPLKPFWARGRWYVQAPDEELYWWHRSKGWQHAAIPDRWYLCFGWWACALIGGGLLTALLGGLYYSFLGSVLPGSVLDPPEGRYRVPAPAVWFAFLPFFLGAWITTAQFNSFLRTFYLGADGDIWRRWGERAWTLHMGSIAATVLFGVELIRDVSLGWAAAASIAGVLALALGVCLRTRPFERLALRAETPTPAPPPGVWRNSASSEKLDNSSFG